MHLVSVIDRKLLYHTYNIVFDDWHYYLALGVPVACDVTRKLVNIRNKLCLATGRRSTADTTTKGYGLTSHFALERTQEQLLWPCWI